MTSEEKSDLIILTLGLKKEDRDYLIRAFDVHAAEQREMCAYECGKLKWAHRSVRSAMQRACLNAIPGKSDEQQR